MRPQHGTGVELLGDLLAAEARAALRRRPRRGQQVLRLDGRQARDDPGGGPGAQPQDELVGEPPPRDEGLIHVGSLGAGTDVRPAHRAMVPAGWSRRVVGCLVERHHVADARRRSP